MATVQPSAVNGAQAVDGIVAATVVSVAYQRDTVAVSDCSSSELRDLMKEGMSVVTRRQLPARHLALWLLQIAIETTT